MIDHKCNLDQLLFPLIMIVFNGECAMNEWVRESMDLYDIEINVESSLICMAGYEWMWYRIYILFNMFRHWRDCMSLYWMRGMEGNRDKERYKGIEFARRG